MRVDSSIASRRSALLFKTGKFLVATYPAASSSMEEIKIAVAVAAFCLSLASFAIAHLASKRAKKAELITHLLGNKETVAFAALKVLRDGLPKSERDRALILASLVQTCVFSGSDRARALLYRVVEINRGAYVAELRAAASTVSETFDSMDRYQFEAEDMDLARGRRRLAGLLRVIEGR